MKRSLLSILLLLFCFNTTTNAQEGDAKTGLNFNQCFIFAYDVNIPVGKDRFIDATSWVGANIEYRIKVAHNITVGADLTWDSFYEYVPTETYAYNSTTDITTDLYRYNYTLPIALTSHYYFPVNSKIFTPYAGIGLGATYSDASVFANIYEVNDETWGFLVRPEIGAIAMFGEGASTGVLLGVRYSYSTNYSPEFKIGNLQSVGFQLGLIWTY